MPEIVLYDSNDNVIIRITLDDSTITGLLNEFGYKQDDKFKINTE